MNVFMNSHQRRRNYRAYLKERGEIDDAGSLDHILDNLLPGEIEDILDSPVMNVNENVYTANINDALNRTICYEDIPSKMITGMFLVSVYTLY